MVFHYRKYLSVLKIVLCRENSIIYINFMNISSRINTYEHLKVKR